eukprot:8462191-Pyramimonas_sp.AAC.2
MSVQSTPHHPHLLLCVLDPPLNPCTAPPIRPMAPSPPSTPQHPLWAETATRGRARHRGGGLEHQCANIRFWTVFAFCYSSAHQGTPFAASTATGRRALSSATCSRGSAMRGSLPGGPRQNATGARPSHARPFCTARVVATFAAHERVMSPRNGLGISTPGCPGCRFAANRNQGGPRGGLGVTQVRASHQHAGVPRVPIRCESESGGP